MTFFIICQHADEAACALIDQARRMTEGRVTAVLWDADDAHLLAQAGADAVHVFQSTQDDAAMAQALAAHIARNAPDCVLWAATIRNRCIAPYVAACLHTGLTADCTALSLDTEGLLLQTRPAFGGNVMAEIVCPRARPQMASVRPKVFPPARLSSARTAEILHFPMASASERVRRIGWQPYARQTALQDAQIVIAGGKGVGSRAGFERLAQCAARMGGALGATRSAVDAGYAPYACQIGQTGVIVRPRLYLAVGISGAIQHIAGMSGAQTVAAINIDPRAPIFRYANFGVVGDWEAVWSSLLEKIEEAEV